MSLYFEASKFLGQSSSSLKSRVFSEKNLKSQPNQIYALVIETRKWSPILKEIIDNASLLSLERKLTPELALLLVHDLLLSKRGIAAPANHKLRTAVEKNKARLQSELTKARLRRKCATLDQLRAELSTFALASSESVSNATSDGDAPQIPVFDHARWVRINRLKTTLEDQMRTTFASYETVDNIKAILTPSASVASKRILHIDTHIPDLVALPPNTDLSKERAYLEGKLIIQDKASCFPAYLLNPQPEDGIVVDGCAAPGNKTTHLSALRHIASFNGQDCQIVACERDKSRAGILQKMIKTAGAEDIVTVKAGQDFLRTDPQSAPWCDVGALLLDPSCSGSGIVGRDEKTEAVALPSIPLAASSNSKKRKRGSNDQPAAEAVTDVAEESPEESVSKDRLAALSAFQAKLVLHALSFPKAHKVTYSTCSIHDEENEHVIATVLKSSIAKERGWTILLRDDQVDGMKRWHLRGKESRTDSFEVGPIVAEACIRCEKHTLDGTQGFFVAAFVRKDSENIGFDAHEDSEVEWGGFDD